MNISNNAGIDSNDLAKRGESLIRKSTNRYLTTVKIAFRAKQRRFDDFDGLLEESTIKPCLLYTSPSPRDKRQSRMPSSA